MNSYLLSIITTTYNHGGFIQSCIGSVLSQSILKDLPPKSIQWIIVEDGSVDDTAFCISKQLEQSNLDKFDVTYIRHLGNMGAYTSFIHAFSMQPAGLYWTILEGDDMWKPDFLSKSIGFLDNNPDFIGVHSDTDYLNGTTLEKDHWKVKGRYDNIGNHYSNIPSGNIYGELLKNNFIMTCAAVFRKAALPFNNLQLFKAKNYLMSDYPFYLSLAKKHKIGYIDESLALYRCHAGGVSNDPAKRQTVVDSTLRVQDDSRRGIL